MSGGLFTFGETMGLVAAAGGSLAALAERARRAADAVAYARS